MTGSVNVQQHPIFGRSAKLTYTGYAALGCLPEPGALLNVYGLLNQQASTPGERLPGSRQERGFTLLEVMIALAIIAITFTALLSSQSTGVALSAEARFKTSAPLLAQELAARLATDDFGYSASIDGDWGEEFPGYRWEATLSAVNPGWDPAMEELLRRTEIVVFWGEGRKFNYRLTSYSFQPQNIAW